MTTCCCSSIRRPTPWDATRIRPTCWWTSDEVGAQLLRVDRGGDVTFHGPGQLVAYPILTLPGSGRGGGGPSDIAGYVATLEAVLIDTLEAIGLAGAGRHDGYPGVWVGPEHARSTQGGGHRGARRAWADAARRRAQRQHRSQLVRPHRRLRDPRPRGDLVARRGRRRGDAPGRSMPSSKRSPDAGNPARCSARTRCGAIARPICRRSAGVRGPARSRAGRTDAAAPTRPAATDPVPTAPSRDLEPPCDRGNGTSVRLLGRLAEAGVSGGVELTDRKPEWMRAPVRHDREVLALRSTVRELDLVTVCEEAGCPNLSECWSEGTATFMVCGERCTRACGFCLVDTRRPEVLDADEPARVAEAVERMGLEFAVLTMVARDDLPDGGAAHVAATVGAIRASPPRDPHRGADLGPPRRRRRRRPPCSRRDPTW